MPQPPEGYAGHFFAFIQPEDASSPTFASWGKSGVPLDVFLQIMHEVKEESETDLVWASHVCKGWRKAILGCEHLWGELEDVEAGSLFALDRVRGFAERSKGNLRTLSITFDAGLQDLHISTVPIIVKQVLQEVAKRDGGKSLTEFELDLRGLRYHDDIEPIYAAIFAEFSAVRSLKTFKIYSTVDRFPAGAPFFFALPGVEYLVLTSEPYELPGDARLPDFFSASATLQNSQISSCALKKLVLSGVSLLDSVFPDFPHLSVIKMCLPRLKNVGIASSPFLWSTPTQTSINFVTLTPALTKASFTSQQHFDEHEQENEGVISYCDGLSTASLTTFLRNSPALAHVNLSRCTLPADMLASALASAPATLTTLCIGGTAAACDAVIDRLHTLLPQLKWLDVWSPDKQGKVSVLALARLAQRLKRSNVLSWWIGSESLTIVTNNPFSDDDPTLPNLRSSVRALLLTLSDAQLAHIPPHLDLNLTPSTPSYDAVKAELLALPAPPPEPPYPAAGPPAGATPAELAAKQKKLNPPYKPPASQQIFDDTVAAVKRWNKRREEELAIERMEKAGVQLEWSERGGGGGGNVEYRGCEHPGADLWEADEETDK
ncbi:hypothetical protein Rt10032_c12g4712 [Rhodotorula toruloides]|uniref:F-box domain-containing protein n=1 Tax=Rhodotorula toruloides TaxID=5286 RepID=A0A511KL80_RHOTO|nr:hypothetical protein Rt10032_c12g4712 [Rhodotorula toruloides]